MEIFSRQKEINIKLSDLTMEEIMNFQSVKNVESEEFYLNEVFHSNHIQMAVNQSKVYSSGIHDFEYDTKMERIFIFSRYRKSAFLIYSYAVFPIFCLNSSKEVFLNSIGMALAWGLFATLLLVIGIRSESKEIEREMIIRINYLRRNKS